MVETAKLLQDLRKRGRHEEGAHFIEEPPPTPCIIKIAFNDVEIVVSLATKETIKGQSIGT